MRPLPPVPNPPSPSRCCVWNASAIRLRDWPGTQHRQRDRDDDRGRRDALARTPRRRGGRPGRVERNRRPHAVEVLAGLQAEQDQVADARRRRTTPTTPGAAAPRRTRCRRPAAALRPGPRAAPTTAMRSTSAASRPISAHSTSRTATVVWIGATLSRVVRCRRVDQRREVGERPPGGDQAAPGVRRDEAGREPGDEQDDAGPDVERAGAAVPAQQGGRGDDDRPWSASRRPATPSR